MLRCLHSVCALRLWETRLIDNRLVNLEQKISRQTLIPALEWALLTAFNQFYIEVRERKSREDLKSNLVRKGWCSKLRL